LVRLEMLSRFHHKAQNFRIYVLSQPENAYHETTQDSKPILPVSDLISISNLSLGRSIAQGNTIGLGTSKIRLHR
jgi:hypothetical protein